MLILPDPIARINERRTLDSAIKIVKEVDRMDGWLFIKSTESDCNESNIYDSLVT
jgi:hypothetical protein